MGLHPEFMLLPGVSEQRLLIALDLSDAAAAHHRAGSKKRSPPLSHDLSLHDHTGCCGHRRGASEPTSRRVPRAIPPLPGNRSLDQLSHA